MILLNLHLEEKKENNITLVLKKIKNRKKNTFLHLKAQKQGELLIKEVLLHLLLLVMMLVVLLPIQRMCMPLNFLKLVLRHHLQVWMFQLRFHHLLTLFRLHVLKLVLKPIIQQTLRNCSSFLWRSKLSFMNWSVNFRTCNQHIKPLQFLCMIKYKP